MKTAFFKSSVFGDRIRRIRVDGKAIRKKEFAFSNIFFQTLFQTYFINYDTLPFVSKPDYKLSSPAPAFLCSLPSLYQKCSVYIYDPRLNLVKCPESLNGIQCEYINPSLIKNALVWLRYSSLR